MPLRYRHHKPTIYQSGKLQGGLLSVWGVAFNKRLKVTSNKSNMYKYIYIYIWSPSENWRKKLRTHPMTSQLHHLSISFLNLFQAPSRPFQLPEVSSQQQEWIGRSCPKMLFRSFPARRSLTKTWLQQMSWVYRSHWREILWRWWTSCGLRCTNLVI